MPDTEIKFLTSGLGIKSFTEEGEIAGYLATFGNIDQGGDVIEKEAFDRTLAEHAQRGSMPKMLWQHDPSKPIGVWSTIEKDEKGILGKGRLLLETRYGKEAYILTKSKAIDGISIGYRTRKSLDLESGARSLLDLDLLEGSIVTFPMNTMATVTGVKSLDSIRDVERILRDAGVPNAFAKLVASHGYDEAKSILECQQREAEAEKEFTEKAPSLLKLLRQLEEKLNA